MLATRCPFCGSARVRPAGDGDGLRPSRLAPFAFDRAEARAVVQDWLSGRIRGVATAGKLPTRFPELLRWMYPAELAAAVVQLEGIYLPYWSFGATGEGVWEAKVGSRRRRTFGKGWTTRWSQRRGRIQRRWTDVLVAGTSRVPPRLLQALLPFRPDAWQPYTPARLAGWQALAFDLPLAGAWTEAMARMRAEAREDALPKRMTRDTKIHLVFSGEQWEYTLMPVWVGVYRYDGKPWRVLVNGQTGAVAGTRPFVRWRVWAASALILSLGCASLLLPALGLVTFLFSVLGVMALWSVARQGELGPQPKVER